VNDPYQNDQSDLQSQRPQLAYDYDLPQGILEHVLTHVADDYYLPGWMRSHRGFQLLCKSAAHFHLAHSARTAETGQAVPMEEANTLARDALFSELALVAGPGGWHDENSEHVEQAEDSVYVPRERLLHLLEGATAYLAAINWNWAHALPRAAFLTFCVRRILDDRRVAQFIQQLPPDQQEVSLTLSKELVRSP
jgi:hypothetical protein